MRLYLVSDVALLADVFQMFRYNSLDEYQLDPAYFMSALQCAAQVQRSPDPLN